MRVVAHSPLDIHFLTPEHWYIASCTSSSHKHWFYEIAIEKNVAIEIAIGSMKLPPQTA
jgi:hypothetical protein